jgi:hypothetical protein
MQAHSDSGRASCNKWATSHHELKGCADVVIEKRQVIRFTYSSATHVRIGLLSNRIGSDSSKFDPIISDWIYILVRFDRNPMGFDRIELIRWFDRSPMWERMVSDGSYRYSIGKCSMFAGLPMKPLILFPSYPRLFRILPRGQKNHQKLLTAHDATELKQITYRNLTSTEILKVIELNST